ncbi:intracellular protein transport protein USO1, partial [Reticulomyxa filosa]
FFLKKKKKKKKKKGDLNLDIEQAKEDARMYKTKWSTSQKQLFGAKREIDQLQERVDALTKEVEEEKKRVKIMEAEMASSKTLQSGNNENNHNNGDNTNVFLERLTRKRTLINAGNEFELLELHQEITELNAKLARKDIEMETLQQENEKWQNAHDSIWNAFNESQKELGRVKGEMDDAQLFYKKKLTKLRDIIQDNEIELFQYEKRVEELEEMYLEKAGAPPPKWKKAIRGDRNVPRLSAMFMEASKTGPRLSGMRDSLLSTNSSTNDVHKIQNNVQISFRNTMDPKLVTVSTQNLIECDEGIDMLNPFGSPPEDTAHKESEDPNDNDEELEEDKEEPNQFSPFARDSDSDVEAEKEKSTNRENTVVKPLTITESTTSEVK